ncbi:MAG: ABC transporter ATP-binding protein [Candidatus Omnitrophica bacterium]|nr:ABC transporter ATP-binding protein [Candidatus Omnitrophota bacterium]
MSTALYELEGVRFTYLGKFPALTDINLTVEKGQRVAVIGANGSGKSTLLNILDGLIFPDSGVVRFCGDVLEETSFREERSNRLFRSRVGLVFQNPDIQLFCPTVKDEILFGPLTLGLDTAAVAAAFDEITAIFGIKGLADRMPHQLSIGEKRKVAMAAVLVSSPDVLLLDEPTAGLDPRTTRDLIGLLNRYHAGGKTIITATHDMHVVEEIADVVHVFSRDKTIIRSGRPDDILADTKFLEEHNLIHIHAHSHDGTTHAHPHQHVHHDHLHKNP